MKFYFCAYAAGDFDFFSLGFFKPSTNNNVGKHRDLNSVREYIELKASAQTSSYRGTFMIRCIDERLFTGITKTDVSTTTGRSLLWRRRHARATYHAAYIVRASRSSQERTKSGPCVGSWTDTCAHINDFRLRGSYAARPRRLATAASQYYSTNVTLEQWVVRSVVTATTVCWYIYDINAVLTFRQLHLLQEI